MFIDHFSCLLRYKMLTLSPSTATHQTLQCPRLVEYRELSESVFRYRTRPIMTDRTCHSVRSTLLNALLLWVPDRMCQSRNWLDALVCVLAACIVNWPDMPGLSGHPEISVRSMENMHFTSPNPSLPLKLHLLCKCANTNKYSPPCACVLVHNYFLQRSQPLNLPRHSILATMQS
jgi:hypothetical protein